MMKIADLVGNGKLSTDAKCDLVVSGDRPVREVLLMMQEKGIENIGVRSEGVKDTVIVSKDELLQGLLLELDCSYEQVVNLQHDIEENFECQVDVVNEGISELVNHKENKLSIAVDYLEEGMIILDVDGQVERANPASRRFLECDEQSQTTEVKAELERLGFLTLLYGDYDNILSDIGKNTKDKWGEYRVKNSIGRVIQMRWSDITSYSGKSMGKVIMLKDVTDEQADEKAKTEFIAAITHELRTPLTIIQNSVSNILAGVTGKVGKKTTAYLDTILLDCHRFGGLISDLLDMSKIETGKMSISRNAVRISELVEDVIKTFSNEAESQGIQIIRRIDKNAPALFIDRDRIHQVLVNLMGNAIKFTDKEGAIIIRVSERQDDVVFSIEDSGIGILPSLQKQVFNKFHQIGRQAGAGYKGAGLGLAICNGIVTMHGGSMWVESEPGLGSKFYFSIPKTDPSLILNKYMNEIAETIDKKGGGFLLAVVEFRHLTGEENITKMMIEQVFKELISESESFLKSRGDMVLRLSDTELFFVVREPRKFASIRKKIVKVMAEQGCDAADCTFECKLGTAVYPEDTKEVLELENLARLKEGNIF